MATPQLIRDFKSALGFMTIIPPGRIDRFSPFGMIRFFPLVGLIIGAGLAAVDFFGAVFWPDAVTSVLCVLYLTAVTGALHLDGLGDTADGIFSHRSKVRALEIMKDSRIGMMGLLAVVTVLALKTAGIFAINTGVSPRDTVCCLLFIPALSRSAMLFGIRCLPYGRESGTGHDLFSKPLPAGHFFFVLVPLAGLLLTSKGWLIILCFGILTGLMLLFYKNKLGVITGDMLGAMSEVNEAVLFVLAGIQMV